jgi:hypothetical protein
MDKQTPPALTEEEWAAYIDRQLAKREKAGFRFHAALEAAAQNYESHKMESAPLAVRAALDFVNWSLWSEHLRAPLIEAADFLELNIDPDRRETYRQSLHIVRQIGAADSVTSDKPDDPWFTKVVFDKISGSVAVELQLRCGISLNDALKNVVGRDMAAARKLKDFRNNMKRLDTPKGARKAYYELIQVVLGRWLDRGYSEAGAAKGAAKEALQVYKAMQGKKS